ncbi:Asp23/Gls24 family envelope stress response protein [Kibdelosporangium phytohabitans]|uniref:Asp23/Gls24 family envelope stress response protein n=1 Tax=Kibdelosporangium phytohabitans TaxID=860235 RepID=A0A0N9I2Q5_9PSEU|nr:Asp23/Gls24 family envelope stress response protein [Kibdelosporangium phytohabitans]ALG09954.1 hypothetical protein AOZ06_26360 [Kibdelosporangium phytohabitans]MBE1468634.1 putative alkaline shock family protein YloU [Kibdelosporangium phytohabitans]
MFESVISAPVVAAIAVDAASRVPGVRVQPGLTDLVGAVARLARQRVKGLAPAATEGVRVRFPSEHSTSIKIDIALSGLDQATAAAHLVQQAVAGAVTAATGLAVTSVQVSILDIDLPQWFS